MSQESAESDTPPPIQSVLKAITWRLVASVDTFVISYLITGNVVFAGSIVGIEVVSKMIVYYVHERAWARGWHIWRQRTARRRQTVSVAALQSEAAAD